MSWEVMIFPIYGITVGISYWNTEMDAFEGEELDDIEYMIQLFFGFFGVSIIWRKYV